MERNATIRRLAIASLAGQLVWFVTIAVAGAFEPGYSELRDPVSTMGARDAARPWLFDVAIAIWGLSLLAAAAALWLDAPRAWRGRLGPALIGFTGVAQILAGFPFPADCRVTIDAWCEAKELAGDVSWRHVAHGWAYFLGSVALLLSVFAMSWRFRGDRRWGRFASLTLLAGFVAAVIVGGLFFVVDDSGEGSYGLFQHLALAAGGLWVAALTAGLLVLRPAGGPEGGAPEPAAGPDDQPEARPASSSSSRS